MLHRQNEEQQNKGRKMNLPDIVISSYLGAKEVRNLRLYNHLTQRKTLAEMFPHRTILSICSGYESREKKTLDKWECLFLAERTPKWQKHNMILEKLYTYKEPRAVLFLDDDTLPRTPQEDDLENGYQDTPGLIKFWLDYPHQMPGHLLYFAISGLKFDIYFRSDPMVMGKAPITVSGAAMMARNDLKILYSEDLCKCKETGLMMDDVPFRVLAEAEGKFVAKCYRAFFKLFSNSKDNSSVYTDMETRKRAISLHLLRLRRKYPHVFATKTKPANDGSGGFGVLNKE